jgi:hypothetical protein
VVRASVSLIFAPSSVGAIPVGASSPTSPCTDGSDLRRDDDLYVCAEWPAAVAVGHPARPERTGHLVVLQPTPRKRRVVIPLGLGARVAPHCLGVGRLVDYACFVVWVAVARGG